MNRLFLISILVISVITGCTSSGAFLAANQTNVELNEANYELKATNVHGESEADYILGLSFSNGFATNTIAIARVGGTDKLYSDALKNLWDNYESEYGAISNKELALINVRYDSDIINLILYTKVRITVRADVVQFIKSD